MSDQSAADFMRDQLEALLASPAFSRVASRHTEGSPDTGSAQPDHDRDTEPSIDAELLRDALQAGLK